MICLVQRLGAGDRVDGALLQMVLQVFAYARQFHPWQHTRLLQDLHGPNAGPLEDLWAANCAGTQDDLRAGLHDETPAALPEDNTCRLLVLKRQRFRQCIRLHTEVRAILHGLEKSTRGRPAPPGLLVDMKVARPFIVPRVEVRRSGNTDLLSGIADSVKDIPAHARRLDAPLAAHAVHVTFPKEVILDLPEDRQDILPPPSRQSAV